MRRRPHGVWLILCVSGWRRQPSAAPTRWTHVESSLLRSAGGHYAWLGDVRRHPGHPGHPCHPHTPSTHLPHTASRFEHGHRPSKLCYGDPSWRVFVSAAGGVQSCCRHLASLLFLTPSFTAHSTMRFVLATVAALLPAIAARVLDTSGSALSAPAPAAQVLASGGDNTIPMPPQGIYRSSSAAPSSN